MAHLPLGVMIGVGKILEGKLLPLREAGFATLQTSTPPAEYFSGAPLSNLRKTITSVGFTVTSVAAVYAGEDYSNIEKVRTTVGILPLATRASRIEDTKRTGNFAKELGAAYVSCHIGYIPEDRSDTEYKAIVSSVQEICDYLMEQHQGFNLETGQETAALLKEFIAEVDRPNLGVNFDPANMIMYGTGDPIEALTILAPWVRGIHCKDGIWPSGPGQLGEERRLGDGEVGLDRFLATVVKIGYDGPLTVEREVPGDQQITDMIYAAGLLNKVKADLGV